MGIQIFLERKGAIDHGSSDKEDFSNSYNFIIKVSYRIFILISSVLLAFGGLYSIFIGLIKKFSGLSLNFVGLLIKFSGFTYNFSGSLINLIVSTP